MGGSGDWLAIFLGLLDLRGEHLFEVDHLLHDVLTQFQNQVRASLPEEEARTELTATVPFDSRHETVDLIYESLQHAQTNVQSIALS